MSYTALLRAELAERNRAWAERNSVPHVQTSGGVVAYLPYWRASHQRAEGVLERMHDSPDAHGNFFPAAWQAIQARPDWARRLRKPHTSRKRALPSSFRDDGSQHSWGELDSSMSSDALLMNIFCTPGVLQSETFRRLLDIAPGEGPSFGIPGWAPRTNGAVDRTQIDMRLGDLVVEAKLTEPGFESKPEAFLAGYRDFTELFHMDLLACDEGKVRGYQLIRNILAAYARGLRFCLIADGRRPDLLDAYSEVQRAIVSWEMRTRSTVLTWQELSAACPPRLRVWLSEKYGIEAGCTKAALRQRRRSTSR